MLKDIRYKLIEIARMQTTWSYSQLNDQLQLGLRFTKSGPDNKLIGEWLGEISIHEFNKGRPLLSSLIIHKNDKEQGEGFYSLCEQLLKKDRYLLKADKEWEKKVQQECYSYWLNEVNYKKYYNDF